MKTIKLIKHNTNIQFLKFKKATLIMSITICFFSIFSLFLNGLNFGIDFKGGTLIEVSSENNINISNVRSVLSSLNLGDVQIQNFGSEKNILVRIEASSSENNSNALSNITNQLILFGKIQRTEVVGPKISTELIQKGILAIISAVGLMLFYIWIRFEWQFSLGAVDESFNRISVDGDTSTSDTVFVSTTNRRNLEITTEQRLKALDKFYIELKNAMVDLAKKLSWMEKEQKNLLILRLKIQKVSKEQKKSVFQLQTLYW